MAKSLNVFPYQELDNLSIEQVSYKLAELQSHPIESVNWPTVCDYKPVVSFSIAYSDNYIYVRFDVEGEGLKAVNTANLSPVAKDSCVEFFLKVPQSDEYWNFEFNCIGTVNASHRVTRPNAIRLTDAQISTIKRHSSVGTEPFEEIPGMHRWHLTIAIPFDLINGDNPKPTHLLANFYKCADSTTHPHYLSWSQIDTDRPNFHTPQFFGKLVLK